MKTKVDENTTPETIIAEAMVGAGAPLMHSRVEEAVAGALRKAGMLVERDAALAAVEAVRALHEPFEAGVGRHYCGECSGAAGSGNLRPWPCPTVAALDGAPEPEWEYQWGVPGESFEGFDSFATEEMARAEMELDSDYPSHRVMRRRKAGPWLPVEGESKP